MGSSLLRDRLHRNLDELLALVEMSHNASNPVCPPPESGIEEVTPGTQASELERVIRLLVRAGICPDCEAEIRHHMDEPVYSCDCEQGEWTSKPPVIFSLRQQVAELKSVLRRKAEKLAAYESIAEKCGLASPPDPSIDKCSPEDGGQPMTNPKFLIGQRIIVLGEYIGVIQRIETSPAGTLTFYVKHPVTSVITGYGEWTCLRCEPPIPSEWLTLTRPVASKPEEN